jgi:hypothetical protein
MCGVVNDAFGIYFQQERSAREPRFARHTCSRWFGLPDSIRKRAAAPLVP